MIKTILRKIIISCLSVHFYDVFLSVFPIFRRYKSSIIVIMMLSFCVVFLDVLCAAFVAAAYSVSENGSSIISLPIVGEVDLFPGDISMQYKVIAGISIVIISQLVREFVLFLNQYLPASLAASIEGQAKERIVGDLLSQDGFPGKSKNDLLYEVMNFTPMLASFVLETISVVSAVSVTMFYVISILVVAPIPFVAICIVFLAVVFVSNRLITVQQKMGRGTRSVNLNLHDKLQNVVYGIKEVAMANQQAYFFDVCRKQISRLVLFRLWQSKAVALVSPVQRALSLLLIGGLVIILLVVPSEPQKVLTFEKSILVVFLLFRIYGPITQLNTLRSNLLGRVVYVGELLKILDVNSFELKAEDSRSSSLFSKSLSDVEELAANSVRFSGVSYNYKNAQANALSDVSLDCPPGKVTAIVGPSGAGKSTVVDLLTKFIAPSSGSIVAGRRDLKDIPSNNWRERISLIAQSGFLFRGTLRQNITMFRKRVSQQALDKAIVAANLREYIDTLPQGLDTLIGGPDFNMSGGQRQRVLIARALVSEPEFLILDEATSAQDALSELEIMSQIRVCYPNITMLIIAHRFSTIKEADHIFVMNRGRVVQSGSWEELERQEGLFRSLFSIQRFDTTENGIEDN